MKERIHFLQDHLKGLFSFTELCEVYRVSRKTGYKWVDRFAQEGLVAWRTDPALPSHVHTRLPRISPMLSSNCAASTLAGDLAS